MLLFNIQFFGEKKWIAKTRAEMYRERNQKRNDRKYKASMSIDKMCIIDGCVVCVRWRRVLRENCWWIIMSSKAFQGSKQWIRQFSLDGQSIAGWRIPMHDVKHCLPKPWPCIFGLYVLLIRGTIMLVLCDFLGHFYC